MAAGKGRIGFLVNPIAGMGGPVGLKGTDGLAEEAIAMGARPRAMERARACLDLLSKRGMPFSFLLPAALWAKAV